MYCRDGRPLTTDDMAQMAIDAGLCTQDKIDGWASDKRGPSFIEQLVMGLLYEMWGRCELTMEPRPNYVAPDPPVFDWEVYEWLKGRRA